MHAFHRVSSVKCFGSLLAGLMAILPVAAAAIDNDEPEIRNNYVAPKSAGAPQAVPLPAYPDADALLPIEVDTAGSPFRFYLDPASLSLVDRSVIRYTLVAESPSGARNVFYEGIHCMNRAFIAYAYGINGGFQAVSHLRWLPLSASGSHQHHRGLHGAFFCDNLMIPIPPADIIDRVKYQRPAGGDLSDD